MKIFYFIGELKKKLLVKREQLLALDDMKINVNKKGKILSDFSDNQTGLEGSFRKLEVDWSSKFEKVHLLVFCVNIHVYFVLCVSWKIITCPKRKSNFHPFMYRQNDPVHYCCCFCCRWRTTVNDDKWNRIKKQNTGVSKNRGRTVTCSKTLPHPLTPILERVRFQRKGLRFLKDQ